LSESGKSVTALTPASGGDVAVRDRRPLSVQVYTTLRAEIVGGRYAAGAQLPTEEELAAKFGVSRVTVREALRLLQGELLIEARQGRGRFVLSTPSLVRKPVDEWQSVTELMRGLGYEMDTEIVSVGVQEAGVNAVSLEVAPTTPLVRLERLRWSSGEAMIYSVDLFPEEFVPASEPDWSGSLISVLESADKHIVYSRATIRAVVLPRSVAKRARAASSQPWVLMDQVNFSADHQPLLRSLDYHRGDRFEFDTLRYRRGTR
jgi:GntR family transcriptional regulator